MKKIDFSKMGIGHIITSRQNGIIHYLTIGNNGAKLMCFQEIKEHNKSENCFCIKILDKEYVFDTGKIFHLSGKRIEEDVAHVSFEDKNRLNELLKITFLERKSEKKVDTNELVRVGDILSMDEQTFLLLDIHADYYLCAPFQKEPTMVGVPFRISKTKEFVNAGSLSNINYIELYEESQKKLSVQDETIGIGSLVEKNNQVYYIYDEQQKQWKATTIDFSSEKHLDVDGFSYPSSLKIRITIPKNSNRFIKLAQANLEEIESNYFQFYKKTKNDILVSQKKYVRFSLETGSWVKRNTTSKEYIALLKSNENIVCLDLSKYLNGDIYIQAFPANDFTILGHIESQQCKEILESLQDLYSSFYVKGEIKSLLARLDKN